ATDVYALGAILYELLIGRPPFRADSVMKTMQQVVSIDPVAPRLLQPKIPRDLETICLKCLEKEPRKRYASAQELADDLRRFLAGEPIRARPTPLWERGLKWAKRRPAVAALLGVCVVAVLALLGLGGWYHARLQNAFDEVSRRRDEVQEQHRQAVQRMVRLNVATGMSLVDDGDLLGSLPSLVDALRLESGNAEREEMHRIRLAAVIRQCPRLA